jgi:hypothetical protein
MKKYQKFMAGFDLHGDMQDRAVTKKFFQFSEAFKPDIKIMGGDLFDFRGLRKKADKAEQAESLSDDVACGIEFLSKWMDGKGTKVWLRGNHCQRLWDVAESESDGLKRDAAIKGVQELDDLCKTLGIKTYPYSKRLGIHREGRLCFLHGYAAGVYALRKTLQSYGENVIMGHTHTIQSVSVEGLVPKQGWVAGCLCQLDYEYNRSMLGTLNHENGWIYGLIFDDGSFAVYQARQISGKWILPMDFKEI